MSAVTDRPLEGKVALITGAAVGIGAAIAERLAAAGADVALTYFGHDPAEVTDSIREKGVRVVSSRVDARDGTAVSAAVSAARAELGAIDILVNNAGGLVQRQGVHEATDEHWHHVIDLNLSSAFYFTRACVPLLGEGGRIVSVSSLAAHNGGGAGAFAYAAGKAGLLGLTRALAKELAPRGITVNAVAPGFILDTPFHEQFTPEAAQRAAVAATPVGRAGSPADIAAAVEYLVSADASFCTGVVLDLNGGTYFI